VNAPEEPDGNGRNDESVSIKQGIGFGGHIPAKILEQQLLLPGKLLSLPRHNDSFRKLINALKKEAYKNLISFFKPAVN
jgi:hypothetical protein